MNELETLTRQEKCLDCCFSIFYKKWSVSYYNKKIKKNWELKKQEDLTYVEKKKIVS